MSDSDFNLDDLYYEARASLDYSENSVEIEEILKKDKKFRFIAEIGSGGMKTIYRVYDEHLRREVALATLNSYHSQKLYGNFVHEAWITAQLDHPNIIKIHELGLDDQNRPFFTMDLKNGQSLEQIVATHEKSETELLYIFQRICDAINYAHSKNIIHLDLKPENIQIDEYGQVVVCDWGLSKMVANKTNVVNDEFYNFLNTAELMLTTSNENTGGRGTPGFMAPEQLHYGHKKDPKTDVYGLGCLLYFMLTSKKISPKLERSTIPRSLLAVIKKSVEEFPENRYASVADLQSDLSQYLLGFSPKAEKTSIFKELFLLFRRNIVVSSLLFISTLLIASFLFVFSMKLNKSHNEEIIAKNRAKKNLLIAEESIEKMEQAIALYKAEKVNSEALLDNYESAFYAPKSYWEVQKYFENPPQQLELFISKLDVILQRSPNDPRALQDKGFYLFLQQDYDQAYITLGKSTLPRYTFIRELIDTLQLKTAPHQSLQTMESIIDYFIKENKLGGHRKATISQLISYDYYQRKNKQEYAPVLEKLLILFNPNWKDRTFHYNPTTQTLNLKGKGLNRIALIEYFDDSSFLRFLPVKRLDLSYTDFHYNAELSTLKIEYLDISYTNSRNLESIRRIPQIKKLVIHKGQFSPEELKKLPNYVSVYVR